MKERKRRLPAEWEPQSGVMLTWPHDGTDWAPMLSEITETYRQIALEISKRERLLIVAPEGKAPGMLHVVCPTNDTWARDHGFISLTPSPSPGERGVYSYSDSSARETNHSPLPGRGVGGEAFLLDFRFNGWGEKFEAGLDNAINRRLYDLGVVKGIYEDHLDFVLEGGSIESDGQGTIFTTTSCLLAPHRNQPLTKEQIEERLKEYLGAERVLWIDHGYLAGDDTDGHIDTLVRICPNDTLLYIGCDDPADEHYDALLLMEQQLRSFRTLDGRPYRLLRLPLPHPIYEASVVSGFPADKSVPPAMQSVVSGFPADKSVPPSMQSVVSGFPADIIRLPATYANFLVINGAVLVPTYAQPDLDAEAMRIIAQAFPGRDIIGIDCRSVIRQHGSLHCCTMQFPEGVIA